MNPEFATYLGNHDFDNRINDYSIEGIQQELNLNRSYLDSLSNNHVVSIAAAAPIPADVITWR